MIQELADVGKIKWIDENNTYTFYAIDGLDSSKIRLAVYKSKKKNVYTFAGYEQQRDIWRDVSESSDTKDIFVGDSSWRDDLGDGFKNGFENPWMWFEKVVIENKAVFA